MFCFVFQQKLSYFQYIYSTSSRKHALRKTAYLRNRTYLCCCKLDIRIRSKLTFTPIVFCTGARSVRCIQPEKRLRKGHLKISPRHLLVNLKNVQVVAPPTLFSIELWRKWQPLIFPPIEASDGALRSVKHERRNVVIRVRGCRTDGALRSVKHERRNVVIRVRGCRRIKIQEYLYRMHAQQGLLLSDLMVVQ